MDVKIGICNYKSVSQAEIHLKPGLTILVGPNGAGKTCLLSSLQFLAHLYRFGVAQAVARQGGARRVFHHGQPEIAFCLEQDYGRRTYRRRKIPCTFRWKVTISQAGRDKIATIVRESFEIIGKRGEEDVTLFTLDVDRAGDKPRVRGQLSLKNEFGSDLFSCWGEAMGTKKKKKDVAEEFRSGPLRFIVGQLSRDKDQSCFPLVVALDSVLRDVWSSFLSLSQYNILPDVARLSAEQLPYAQMAPDGRSVSEVIDALEHRRYDKLEPLSFMDADYKMCGATPYLPGHGGTWFRYYAFPRRMPPRNRQAAHYASVLESINRELSAAVWPISAVSVEIDPTNGRRFVVFKAGEETFHPEEVSDGTVKWLCILVSLFVPFSRVYLIEEPENFLHPWMQQRLIELMREQAKLHGTTFLLSTHSATVLNAAHPEEILVVRQTDAGTTLSAIVDIDDIRNVLAESGFHLGDLWVSGAMGGVPGGE
ncbi:MAG: AAA family ATPase [Candidatus Brocadiia bacterium]